MRSIHIVDDDPSILSIFDYMLSQHGYTISSFDTVKASYLQAIQSPPNIVLLDLTLESNPPQSNIKKFLKIDTNILVIGMLDFKDVASYSVAFEHGAYSVIFKPFDAEEIMSVIQHIDTHTLAS